MYGIAYYVVSNFINDSMWKILIAVMIGNLVGYGEGITWRKK